MSHTTTSCTTLTCYDLTVSVVQKVFFLIIIFTSQFSIDHEMTTVFFTNTAGRLLALDANPFCVCFFKMWILHQLKIKTIFMSFKWHRILWNSMGTGPMKQNFQQVIIFWSTFLVCNQNILRLKTIVAAVKYIQISYFTFVPGKPSVQPATLSRHLVDSPVQSKIPIGNLRYI